MPEQEKRIGKY